MNTKRRPDSEVGHISLATYNITQVRKGIGREITTTVVVWVPCKYDKVGEG